MKASELDGAQLDYWVAKALDIPCKLIRPRDKINGVVARTTFCATLTAGSKDWYQPFFPSSAWAIGGPILCERGIGTRQWVGNRTTAAEPWCAELAAAWAVGRDQLVAGMRALVVFKFGEDVALPA
jgi:hypothetical protein